MDNNAEVRYNHPGYKLREPTKVSIGLQVSHFFGVDDRTKTYRMTGTVQVQWYDGRLLYNSTDAGFDSLRWSFDDIWTPQIYMSDHVEDFYTNSDRNFYLESLHDGTVRYEIAFSYKMLCSDMNFADFPFDSQSCKIRLRPLKNHASDVTLSFLEPGAAGLSTDLDGLELGEWTDFTVSYAGGHDLKRAHFSSTVEVSYADVLFSMRRRTGSVGLTLFLPAILVTLMSYCGYWINPAAAPARVALSVICVLVTISHRGTVLARLPRVSYALWVDSYLLMNLVFNIIAVFSYAIVNFGLQQMAAEQKVADEIHKKTDGDRAAKAADMERPQELELGMDGGADDEQEQHDEEVQKRARSFRFMRDAWQKPRLSLLIYVDHIMRFFFPLSYTICTIALLGGADQL